MKFIKKPVEIEAVQFHFREYTTNPLSFDETPNWLENAVREEIIFPRLGFDDRWCLVIKTLEGDMIVSHGDWIIRGVKGEIYPCKPDIFTMTYSPCDTCKNCGRKNESFKCECGHDNRSDHVCEFKDTDLCIHCGKSTI